jgi:hypothetical protein
MSKRPLNTERDISKLPVWARHRIEKLEADLKWTDDRLQAISAPDARIVANPYDDKPIGFTDNTVFRFSMGEVGDHREIQVNLVYETGADSRDAWVLRVSSNHGQVAVMPRASNSFNVRLVD